MKEIYITKISFNPLSLSLFLILFSALYLLKLFCFKFASQIEKFLYKYNIIFFFIFFFRWKAPCWNKTEVWTCIYSAFLFSGQVNFSQEKRGFFISYLKLNECLMYSYINLNWMIWIVKSSVKNVFIVPFYLCI